MERVLTEEQIQAMADRIADTAAHIDAATHALLTDIRAFDQAGAWHRMGALSCAHYLSWRIGMGLGAAREKVRVARVLAGLPRIDDALARGRLSYSKVRAITRVATADNEDALLDIALSSTAAQLEKVCRLYRQTAPREGSADQRRWLTHRATDDGMVRISIQLRADEAATVLKAIDVSAETGSQADRVVALAETALAGSSGDDTERVRRPVEVLFHVDAATLTGHAQDTGDGVSAETCRRLCCDAGIVPAVERAGRTLDVGRKMRRIPAAIERALACRDDGCRFPGCSNWRFVDAHHIQHWLNGGATRLDNLVSLCRRHHVLLHEGGFTVEMTAAGPRFRTAAGRQIPEQVDRPALARPVDTLRDHVRARGVIVDPDAQIPAWDGLPPQYPHVIDMLVTHGGPPAA